MTHKDDIIRLRRNGLGYKKIASLLAISVNTVKSVCRREGIEKVKVNDGHRCKGCGEALIQKQGKKVKQFCSDTCRMKWWNKNLDKVNRKSYTTHTCKKCGESFKSYANKKRVYCSHQCYINDRFGGHNE
ncbi:sigma-70 family RNA polymerase sigma factor [Carnobacteriaceae bacterium zg-84]|uniref:sigma-70 family RNA polymerase sigma factor n=1 Tax=Granulicatella sp. zg-84 TaxID=2678503 RepID=UPI0013C2007B|nr:sigma-70 family RNA polymerase sigma factor [Granulicatella sp. zg-84]NEW66029.1 RNA polymerase subunit sigma-70 [Granulicatella sp. zg-84]QMI86562.1 sigma-70 family RNA polymerase sigma factor [Carnobacteriaceae bacterium zg-84]